MTSPKARGARLSKDEIAAIENLREVAGGKWRQMLRRGWTKGQWPTLLEENDMHRLDRLGHEIRDEAEERAIERAVNWVLRKDY